ncbi:MAG: sigma-E processing peptidase SpoIIGA [Bacilli bacterium]|nr:sigma-E processing peptidase SpoIIGA [Bacilli bacterium]
MKVYLDLVIIINFLYDYLILTSVSILLHRHIPLKKIIIGSLVGMSSVLVLFLSLSKITLLIFKIVTSLSMVLLTFGTKKIGENTFYFYVITIIIGGFQYLVTGNEYEVNIFIMGVLSPIIIYLYIRSQREYKREITKLYNVIIIDEDIAYTLTGYMDTGNTLKDPITKYPVILVSNKLRFKSQKYFYVPFQVVNNKSILKCVKVDNVIIDNKRRDVLLGLVDDNILKNGVDVILNEYLREESTC